MDTSQTAWDLLRADERRRREFASALHDGIGQRLFALKTRLVVLDDGAPKPLADDVRGFVFQALRERLTNAVKHSGADVVEIRLERRDTAPVATIEDNGAGFDTEAATRPERGDAGFGLFSIRKRLEPRGGHEDRILARIRQSRVVAPVVRGRGRGGAL